MTKENESTALITVPQGSRDPVIEAKKRKLALIEQVATMFKRIDIKFLAIPEKLDHGGTPAKPAFAILPLEHYRQALTCTFNGVSGYSWPGINGESGGNFSEVFEGTQLNETFATATPTSQPTDEANAVVEEHGNKFERLMVAWHASWNSNAGDPLLIGVIDGVWFILAKWDMTDLESFVAGE